MRMFFLQLAGKARPRVFFTMTKSGFYHAQKWFLPCPFGAWVWPQTLVYVIRKIPTCTAHTVSTQANTNAITTATSTVTNTNITVVTNTTIYLPACCLPPSTYLLPTSAYDLPPTTTAAPIKPKSTDALQISD